MEWMLGFFCSGAHDLYFYEEKAEDPIECSVLFFFVVAVVIVVNMWFASIFLYLFLHFYGVILPWVILLLNGDVMYYAVSSKLFLIQGFPMHPGKYLHQGIYSISVVFRIKDTGSTYLLRRLICVRVVMRVCTYARVKDCMFRCASLLTL